MSQALRLLIGLALVAPAFAQRDIGIVDVQAGTDTIAVSVTSSSPELQSLAAAAFNTHGRYRLVSSGGTYGFHFAAASPDSVTLSITKGSAGSPVASETVSGGSLRQALLKAADVAVAKTSGLRGYFAGKIAFVTERGGQQTIMTSDLFFGELQSHPVQGKEIIGPRWSPDGGRIIFTSYRTGFPDIYVLDVRAHQLNVFASFKGTNSGAHFSPDGSRVAMILSGEGNPDIYIGNAQGRQIKRVSHDQSVKASPCWSPDGSRLVFTSDAAGGPQLYLMSAAGGPMSRLTTNLSRYCAEPDWSTADPRKIVFTAGVGRGYQTALYDFGTGTSRIITKAPMDSIEPVWLADGRHVLCTFRTSTSRALYIVDTESGKSVRISPSALGSAGNASYLAP
ncbi:MAG: biopolymer transporter Tol [Opitutales bacterium]